MFTIYKNNGVNYALNHSRQNIPRTPERNILSRRKVEKKYSVMYTFLKTLFCPLIVQY